MLLPKFLNSMLFVKKILLAIASSLQLSSIIFSSVLYLGTLVVGSSPVASTVASRPCCMPGSSIGVNVCQTADALRKIA